MNAVKKIILRVISKVFPKLSILLEDPNGVRLLKSLCLSKRCDGIIKVYKGCNVFFAPSAKINVSGLLEVGARWHGFKGGVTDFVVSDNACLVVNGHFKIFSSSRISVNPKARLLIGNGGFMNMNGNIRCFKSISIGDDVKISENCTISDSDNHILDKSNSRYVMSKPICIGNHVLVGLNSTILKGVSIDDGAIVAAGAVVTKNVPSNSLVGGVPARIIKENISWE